MLPNEIVSIGTPTILQTTGKVWFVCSLGGRFGAAISGSGIGEDPGQPFLTIANAMSRARDNKGDTIICMPGHAETITAAAGLALNKAGVALIGMGWGSNRPTLTMSGSAAASIRVTAANVAMKNFLLTTAVDEHVAVFDVQAANFTLDQVDWIEGSAHQTRTFLTATAAAVGLTMQDCKHYQATAPAAAAAWISLNGAHRARILRNELFVTQANNAGSHIIQTHTAAPANILIKGNSIVQLGGATIVSAINLMAATSGRVDNNNISSTATTLAGINAIASCYAAENYVNNTVNTSGILDPVADMP